MRFQWAKYLYTSCNVSVNISTEIVWKGMYCRMLSKIIGLSKVKARGELSLKLPEFFGFSIFPIINRCLRGSNVVLSHLIFRVTSHLVIVVLPHQSHKDGANALHGNMIWSWVPALQKKLCDHLKPALEKEKHLRNVVIVETITIISQDGENQVTFVLGIWVIYDTLRRNNTFDRNLQNRPFSFSFIK